MLKRLAAATAAIILCVVCLVSTAITASAEENGSCSLVQTSYADKGENFTVDLVLSNNPGVKSISCNIMFPYEDIEFVSASDNKMLTGFFSVPLGNSGVQLTWTGSGNVTDNGVLATITFKALTDSEEGSLMHGTVVAYTTTGARATVDGATTLIKYGSANAPQPDADPLPQLPPEGEQVTDDSVEVMEDEMTEEISDEPEATEPTTEQTEPATTTSEATTTRRSTTTEKKTERPKTTETDPTTAPPVTTAEPTTTVTEPITTPAPQTEPVTTPSTAPEIQSLPEMSSVSSELSGMPGEEDFADVYKESVDNKAANTGTLLIAFIMIALTVVVVIAIEITKRR